ncbi:MAG: methylthioribulose 1-phosphate dehydratase [Polyangia bacterium]|jgi:methylthioribulose-1-phosphate dehydratase
MSLIPYDAERLSHIAEQMMVSTRELAQLGWTPATSSNFSMRIDDRHIAITVSGRDKGRLTSADIMVVDLDGRPVLSNLRPSAETPLHTQLYRRFSDVGCVLHTHSRTQTVASRIFSSDGQVRLRGYELLKAFYGQSTHDTTLDVPILPNSQDIPMLAKKVDELLDSEPLWGYLIESHGMYAWGRDMADARRHLEAYEFLLSCELDLRTLRP